MIVQIDDDDDDDDDGDDGSLSYDDRENEYGRIT